MSSASLMVGWVLVEVAEVLGALVFAVLLLIGVIRHWRNPYLPPGKYPTMFNRRVRRRRR